MKQLPKHIITSLLVIFLLSSCEREENIYELNETKKIDTDLADPEGSILTFLNGKVTLDVPPEAVPKHIKLSVIELLDNECMDMSDCNWIVKMIAIEPQMAFGKPVIVRMEYDRDRVNSELSLHGCAPVIYYWPSDEDFVLLRRREIVNYEFDDSNKSIHFEIKQTGLFAIGVYIPDKN